MTSNETPSKSPPYAKNIDILLNELETDTNNGLSEDQLELKYSKYGYNELPEIKKKSLENIFSSYI